MATEAEQHRLECEARYWIKYAREQGRDEWQKAKEQMRKRRGAKNVQKLVDLMNEQKKVLRQ